MQYITEVSDLQEQEEEHNWEQKVELDIVPIYLYHQQIEYFTEN